MNVVQRPNLLARLWIYFNGWPEVTEPKEREEADLVRAELEVGARELAIRLDLERQRIEMSE